MTNDKPMNVLVTGGAGFIGSAVCRHLLGTGKYRVVNVDKLTYAGDLRSLESIGQNPRYKFYQDDVCNEEGLLAILIRENIQAIMHLAAESHVDRSIDGPAAFVQANVVGTCRLLGAALTYWRGLETGTKKRFRFHHVSTDEVFGDLPFDGPAFDESSPYAPSSPYAASKAAADHFVRAWHKTYGLPVVLSNSANTYGPYHYPEKLIPLVILNALEGREVPIYGTGQNVRDWLFVEDHARALELVLTQGAAGESYNIGGNAERTNLSVAEEICDALDRRQPLPAGTSRRSLIRLVADRPGHDRRYALNTGKIKQELGWQAQESFASGLAKTVSWYLENEWWWKPLREKGARGQRLGKVA